MKINPKHSSLEWLENVKELIMGLGYLATLARKNHLAVPARIIKIASEDLISWAVNAPEKQGDTRVVEQLYIDPDFRAAVDFLNNFAQCDEEELRREVIHAIESISVEKKQRMM